MINHNIREGLSRTITIETKPSHAYVSNSSTIDYLLSTPALISMIIDGSCELLHDLIPSEYTTVGHSIELSHVNPTLIGEKITLKITVTKVEGNKIFLEIVGHDPAGII
jgi:fluoroacetyl-CoA thioesterase